MPDGANGFRQILVTGACDDVGDSGVEVHAADRVAVDRLMLPDGELVLVVVLAAAALGVDEVLGEIEVTLLAGGLGQLDQG